MNRVTIATRWIPPLTVRTGMEGGKYPYYSQCLLPTKVCVYAYPNEPSQLEEAALQSTICEHASTKD